ncbi:hypothetical protein [Mesorhizobium sp. CAU 1741]|uniref:ImuA family protein n=1 Tax=Mesorhizobium sp. CAU 1741 TaxID=3140366 RepID=UPI00325BFB08
MATSVVARETVFALRRQIAKIEGRLAERLEQPAAEAGGAGIVLRHAGRPTAGALLPIGAPSLDVALDGGLPLAGLTEIHGRQTRDAGAVAGFSLALAVMARRLAATTAPLLWIATSEVLSEAGRPYAPGILHRFGLEAEALLLAQTRRIEDALWVAEEAAGLSRLSAVLLEVRGVAHRLDLTATRRLHRRAQAAARPFFLLRQAGQPEPTAAPVRLVVSPAPAGERRLFSRALEGSIGPPAFMVEIGRSRTAMPATAVLEWNEDERAFHERPLAADRTADTGLVVSVSGERPRPADKAGRFLAVRGAA